MRKNTLIYLFHCATVSRISYAHKRPEISTKHPLQLKHTHIHTNATGKKKKEETCDIYPTNENTEIKISKYLCATPFSKTF